MLHFEPDWHALGPFAIGTREDPWFDSVDINKTPISNQAFPSTLCGRARWKSIGMDLESLLEASSGISLTLDYDEVDWPSLVSTYGWVATQFDAWLRGEFWIDQDCFVTIKVRNSPEFMLDGQRYEADIYDLGEPLLTQLTRGKHRLDIRVVNEIRIFGFNQSPVATIKVDIACIVSKTALQVRFRSIPDLVEYAEVTKMSSSFFAVQIDCTSLVPVTVVAIAFAGMIHAGEPFTLLPCQSRVLTLQNKDLMPFSGIEIHYNVAGVEQKATMKYPDATAIALTEPHLLTYKNESQSIGRAVIRPARSTISHTAPVLLALHGANVDIASPAWKDIFKNSYLNAWIVQPDCGKWGDDWHDLSIDSIDSCLHSLMSWRTHHAWTGPAADVSKIFIMGHSNGSQGAMQFMVRKSHRIIGSALASGYTSISRYVPYTMWRTNALAHTERPEYDIVRNVDMMKGIRCFIRHGTEDDNVPIYHSRLLANLDPSIILEECPGKGHWFDGILTEGRLKDFVEDCLQARHVVEKRSWDLPDANNFILERSHEVLGAQRHRYARYRDAMCILLSNGPMCISASDHFAHRISHSLLLYYGIDSVLEQDANPGKGNLIQCVIDDEIPVSQLKLKVTPSGARLVMKLEAANDVQMSRLIRLLPWRTGTGVPGDLLIDTSRGVNMVVHAKYVDIGRY